MAVTLPDEAQAYKLASELAASALAASGAVTSGQVGELPTGKAVTKLPVFCPLLSKLTFHLSWEIGKR
eukprot:5763275-Amphidinium_carterae.1